MEPTAYNITLVVGVMVNGFAGLLLLIQSLFERAHPSYQRALALSGIVLWLYGAGFALHVYFQWRTQMPSLASALTLTYFHLGGMLFSWSHIGLVDPFYSSWKIYVRDLLIAGCAIPCYWAGTNSIPIHYIGYAICVAHCCFFSLTFYTKYYSIRGKLHEVTTDMRIRRHMRFMAVSCNLIIVFGIGGILITSLWQEEEWPYTLLMVASSIVFGYIAASLILYKDVVESVGNAIEDVALMKRDPSYARFIRRIMKH